MKTKILRFLFGKTYRKQPKFFWLLFIKTKLKEIWFVLKWILISTTAITLLLAAMPLLFVGCSDSGIASRNISQAAHQFEIFRRVVFYNGITGEYILEIRAYCSVTPEPDGRISVIIKTEDGMYLKHYLGLSDNVTYFCEQLKPSTVSDKHYRVIFKPSVVLPMIDLE